MPRTGRPVPAQRDAVADGAGLGWAELPPPGWADAGPQTPAFAYQSIVYNGPSAGNYRPSATALISRLGPNADAQKILDRFKDLWPFVLGQTEIDERIDDFGGDFRHHVIGDRPQMFTQQWHPRDHRVGVDSLRHCCGAESHDGR